MKTIHKYRLNIDGDTYYAEIPSTATVVHVGTQDGALTIWAELPLDPPTPDWVRKTYRVPGTGFTFPSEDVYVTTIFDGPFVWHVYEVVVR